MAARMFEGALSALLSLNIRAKTAHKVDRTFTQQISDTYRNFINV
jgi:hypothetical protein